MPSERALINASKTLSLGMGVSMDCFRFDGYFLSCASRVAMHGILWIYILRAARCN